MSKFKHNQSKKIQRYSIRKLTVGAASVLIGAFWLANANTNQAQAAELTPAQQQAQVVETKTTAGTVPLANQALNNASQGTAQAQSQASKPATAAKAEQATAQTASAQTVNYEADASTKAPAKATTPDAKTKKSADAENKTAEKPVSDETTQALDKNSENKLATKAINSAESAKENSTESKSENTLKSDVNAVEGKQTSKTELVKKTATKDAQTADGSKVPKQPAKPGDDITIDVNYSGKDQKAIINYNDQTTGKTIGSQTLTGKTKETQTVSLNVPAGWVLVDPTQVPKNITFDDDTDKDQTYDLSIKHGSKPVDPDTVKKDNPPVDKGDDPTKGQTPDGISYDQVHEEISREIVENQPDHNGGITANKTTEQVAGFKRVATIDTVTGEITYDDWEFDKNNADNKELVDVANGNYAFKEYQPTLVAGYTASTSEVPSAAPDPNGAKKSTVTIDYTANDQHISYQFVDDDENEANVGSAIEVDGKTDQTVDPSAAVKMPAGYKLVGQIPNAVKLSMDNKDLGKIIQIHLKHGTTLITYDKPSTTYKGTKEDELNSNAVKTITISFPESYNKDSIQSFVDSVNKLNSTADGQNKAVLDAENDHKVTITQTISYIRNAVVDLVTGNVTYINPNGAVAQNYGYFGKNSDIDHFGLDTSKNTSDVFANINLPTDVTGYTKQEGKINDVTYPQGKTIDGQAQNYTTASGLPANPDISKILTAKQISDLGIDLNDDNVWQWVTAPETGKAGTATVQAKLTYFDHTAKADKNGNYPVKQISINVPIAINKSMTATPVKKAGQVENSLTYFDEDNNSVVRQYSWVGNKNTQNNGLTEDAAATVESLVTRLGFTVDDTKSDGYQELDKLIRFGDSDQNLVVYVHEIDNKKPILLDQNYNVGNYNRQAVVDKNGKVIADPALVIGNLGNLPKGTTIKWKTAPEYDLTVDTDASNPTIGTVYKTELPINTPIVEIDEPRQKPIYLQLSRPEDKQLVCLPQEGTAMSPVWQAQIEAPIGSTINPRDLITNYDELLNSAFAQTGLPESKKAAYAKYFQDAFSWDVTPDSTKLGYTFGHVMVKPSSEFGPNYLVGSEYMTVLVHVVPAKLPTLAIHNVVRDEFISPRDEFTQEVSYTADQRTAIYKFVDDDEQGKQVGNPITVTGVSDQKGVKVDLTKDVPDGYQVDGTLPTSVDFGTSDPADVTIKLKHVVSPIIKPGNQPKPGDIIPGTKGKTYPDDVTKESSLEHDVTRTVVINYPAANGGTQTTVQKVHFTRTATVDAVTGKVSYTNWTTGKDSFDAAPLAVVNGYVASRGPAVEVDGVKETDPDGHIAIDYNKVGSWVPVDENGKPIPGAKGTPYANDPKDPTKVETTVPTIPGYKPAAGTIQTPSDPTKDTNVTYTANDASQDYSFVDENGKEVEKETVNGKTDGTVDTPALPDGWKLADGQSYDKTVKLVPSDKMKTVVVKVVHGTVVVDHTKPVKSGDKIPGTTNKTYAQDISDTDMNSKGTRTIVFNFPASYNEPDDVKAMMTDGKNHVVQVVKFHRDATVDTVTGKVLKYTDWLAEGDGNYPEVLIPQIPGYKAVVKKEPVETVGKNTLMRYFVSFVASPNQDGNTGDDTGKGEDSKGDKPTTPDKPDQGGQTTKPTDPTKPVTPAKPVTGKDDNQKADNTKPAKPTKPEKPSQSDQTTKPNTSKDDNQKPDNTKPAKPIKPSDSGKVIPTEPSEPAKNSQAEVDYQPVVDGSGKVTIPTELAHPAENSNFEAEDSGEEVAKSAAVQGNEEAGSEMTEAAAKMPAPEAAVQAHEANGESSIAEKSVQSATQESKNSLPQTGEKDRNLGLIGLGIAAVGALLGLAVRRKKD